MTLRARGGPSRASTRARADRPERPRATRRCPCQVRCRERAQVVERGHEPADHQRGPLPALGEPPRRARVRRRWNGRSWRPTFDDIDLDGRGTVRGVRPIARHGPGRRRVPVRVRNARSRVPHHARRWADRGVLQPGPGDALRRACTSVRSHARVAHYGRRRRHLPARVVLPRTMPWRGEQRRRHPVLHQRRLPARMGAALHDGPLRSDGQEHGAGLACGGLLHAARPNMRLTSSGNFAMRGNRAQPHYPMRVG